MHPVTMSGTPTLTSGLSVAGSAPTAMIAVPPRVGACSIAGAAATSAAPSSAAPTLRPIAKLPPTRAAMCISVRLVAMPGPAPVLDQRQSARHLVALDHDALV